MLNLDSQAFSHLHCDQKVAEGEMCRSLNANLYDGITRFFDNHGYAKAWAEVVSVTHVRYDAYPDEDNGTMEAVPVKKFIAYARCYSYCPVPDDAEFHIPNNAWWVELTDGSTIVFCDYGFDIGRLVYCSPNELF